MNVLRRTAARKQLVALCSRGYTRMSTEEYLKNIRDSMVNMNIQEKSMKPLLEANHTSDTQTELFGIPVIPKFDGGFKHIFTEAVGKNMPDLIFLQMDPMPFIVRQRYMSHKCALNEVDDYDVKAVQDFNYPAPYTWQEAVVNLITIDMLRANQIHMKLDYTKGVCTYAYPDLQDERTRDNLHDKFIEAITNHIVCD